MPPAPSRSRMRNRPNPVPACGPNSMEATRARASSAPPVSSGRARPMVSSISGAPPEPACDPVSGPGSGSLWFMPTPASAPVYLGALLLEQRAHAVEQALLRRARAALLARGLRELLDQRALARRQLGRHLDLDVHEVIAARRGLARRLRDAAAADPEHPA